VSLLAKVTTAAVKLDEFSSRCYPFNRPVELLWHLEEPHHTAAQVSMLKLAELNAIKSKGLHYPYLHTH
jgi:hypothetical protein